MHFPGVSCPLSLNTEAHAPSGEIGRRRAIGRRRRPLRILRGEHRGFTKEPTGRILRYEINLFRTPSAIDARNDNSLAGHATIQRARRIEPGLIDAHRHSGGHTFRIRRIRRDRQDRRVLDRRRRRRLRSSAARSARREIDLSVLARIDIVVAPAIGRPSARTCANGAAANVSSAQSTKA